MDNLAILCLPIMSIITMCLTKHAHTHNKQFIYYAIFVNSMVPLLLLYVLQKNDNMTYVNSLWSISSLILTAIIGYIYFNEDINNYKKIGLSLAVVAIVLFQMK